ncbi:MarR family transcriptional regulator [Frankia sp. CNm7]|uniref:MarR family transcriptional regulator n=1 Tax=Frankia nepalensis TaxID=1836974 RepID=A0A937RJ08_9ACTN|nr:MarR family transcriptional regulator [Frankia nepalensis]MBL7498789.1 MarR family transcriptional regulator [Frankia nepalensis]MBL7508594.1 MarR family transcriptional regulator [Frankia nepalensis]MBL7517488.1 MarR family transcriptional regulator [Frankia nepalensis]MBL7629734.1 MarR family transcriptional regulator [Frankia nepalensis]
MGDTDGSTDESLIHAVVKQVVTLAAATSALAADLLKELDLTEPLANALWRLDPDGAAPSMRTLAATLNCDPSTVTFLTDRLEQRGLIQRQPAPTDRRQKVIRLTRRGVEVRTRLVQTLTASSPLAQLSPDDQQHLYALLAKAGADPSQFTCQPTNPSSTATD